MKGIIYFLNFSMAILFLSGCNSEVAINLNSEPTTKNSTPPLIKNFLATDGLKNQEQVILLEYTDSDNDIATICEVGNLVNLVITQACTCDQNGACNVGVTGTADYTGNVEFEFTVTTNSQVSNTGKVEFTIDTPVISASGMWTWIGGSDSSNLDPVYGAIGVYDSNHTPGGRSYPIVWADSAGDIYLFGGKGRDNTSAIGEMNDLWKYKIATQQWAYLGGSKTHTPAGNWGARTVSAGSNWPSARSASAFANDAAGNLWLYGGTGLGSNGGSGRLSDLWKYDLASGEWTWVAGGSRQGIAAVILSSHGNLLAPIGTYHTTIEPGQKYAGLAFYKDDTNEFYLFGGSNGSFYTWQNDMFSYDIAIDQWANRTNTNTLSGNNGTLGVEAISNWPGARHYASGGINPLDGSLYLFGGEGTDKNGTQLPLNDTWKYNFVNGLWTWVAGADIAYSAGSYGVKGVADPSNSPGARYALQLGTFDDLGNFWIYGGWTDNDNGNAGVGDLWKFDTTAKMWTWVAGSEIVSPATVFGDKGIPAAANTPGTSDNHRLFNIGNKIYLFGASGYYGESLWVYEQ